MFFWNKNKRRVVENQPPAVVTRRSSSGHRFPLEVKLLAAQAKEAGLGPKEVAELVGASAYSVSKWHKLYQEGGPEALMIQSSSPGTQRISFCVCLVRLSKIRSWITTGEVCRYEYKIHKKQQDEHTKSKLDCLTTK